MTQPSKNKRALLWGSSSPRATQPSRRFLGSLQYLEDRFQQPIDLLTTNSVKKLYLRRQILRERGNVFGG
jgi:predicted nucleotidyltransferase